jgi:competence ComEA-like helix-hairpin-helix protein
VANGELTEDQCLEQMRILMTEDAGGNRWMADAVAGVWYRHDGTNWVRTAAPKPLVNINRATIAELTTLPGVGPVIAARIVRYRDERGAFRTIGEIMNVDGIGNAKRQSLEELITAG